MFRSIAALLLSVTVSAFALDNHEVGPSLDATDTRTYGVYPFMSPLQLETAFGASVQALNKALGKPILFRTKPTLQQFRDALTTGEYDIVFIQPFDYVSLGRSVGYVPLARRNAELSGILVSHPNSELRSMQQLSRHVIGRIDGSAAWRLMENHLRDRGVNFDRLSIRNFPNHTECLLALMLGRIDGCVTADVPMLSFAKRLGVMFTVAIRTESIPTALFCVHPRLPVVERELLQRTITAWEPGEPLQRWLNFMGVEPDTALPLFVTASDEDYDSLRFIGH